MYASVITGDTARDFLKIAGTIRRVQFVVIKGLQMLLVSVGSAIS